MNETDSSKGYLSDVISRLRDEGFRIRQDVTCRNWTFAYVASLSRLVLERGGLADTHVVFGVFGMPDIRQLKEFSSDSFKCSRKASGIRPPRGLFYSLWCFPVALVDSIDYDTARLVRTKDNPKHWAASETLAVVTLRNREIHFSETEPAWGSMYHEQRRSFLRRMLTP
jgi:hypothetical protein